MKVDQILCAAGPVDAVTNQAFAWRRHFAQWGWTGEDYVANVAPGVTPAQLRPLRERGPGGENHVLLHYSGHAPGLEDVLGPPSLLVSHNVTPARYFWAYQPVDAARCSLARDQLAELARVAGALAGVSEFNARELQRLSGRQAGVIPILFEPDVLPPAQPAPPGPPIVLFVGRLAPHKRHDLVIRAFARYRRRQPDAQLVLVGTSLTEEFEAELRRLAARLAPGAVSFETGGVSPQRLAEHYRSAHAFLCLSEHEGFCIPLLEAFHYGVPVIARDAGAVAEVVGDAGILLGLEDDVATAGELLRIVISDPELPAELRQRGQRRLRAYDPQATAEKMRTTIESL